MLRAYRADSYFESAGEGEGGAPGYSSYLAQEPTLRATFRRLLARMRRLGMTGGRLLEVGCAYGFFLDEARGDFRWRAGTEYSPAAAARARLMADAVYQGGLDEVPAEERFDCAVLIHVIEHVYRPRELVARLVERLRPGGWVVLAAPDMEGFWRPLLGRRWPFFKVPEHVTYFARPSLTQLLAAAGCRRVEPLPYEGSFALELIAEKLGVSLPRWLGRRRLWLPATTAACAGQRPA
jgi:SAM-dependent methyltransferase